MLSAAMLIWPHGAEDTHPKFPTRNRKLGFPPSQRLENLTSELYLNTAWMGHEQLDLCVDVSFDTRTEASLGRWSGFRASGAHADWPRVSSSGLSVSVFVPRPEQQGNTSGKRVEWIEMFSTTDFTEHHHFLRLRSWTGTGWNSRAAGYVFG